MGIYHLSAKVIKRSDGRSSVAAAAYRSGESLEDERQGRRFDYARKQRVAYTAIFGPPSAPPWVYDRSQLWNSIEDVEKRCDAQLAKEFEVSLPIELNAAQWRELIVRFVLEELVARGMIADVAIHTDPEDKNPHAHIMVSLRAIDENGWGLKDRTWNDKALLMKIREAWADHTNRALADAGSAARIDHRSLAAQGEDREPQIHHSNKPIRVQRNAQIIQLNAYRAALILSQQEDRLANKTPLEIQEEARREFVAARFALSELAEECTQIRAMISRLNAQRVTQSACEYLESTSKPLLNSKRQMDRAHNDAKTTRAAWDLWRQAHPIQAELPVELLFGKSAELHRRVRASEAELLASKRAFRITQEEVFDPKKLKVLTARINAYNKKIDESLYALRSRLNTIEPATAAVQERVKLAMTLWASHGPADGEASIADCIPRLQTFNMPSSHERSAKLKSPIFRPPLRDSAVEP